MPYIYLPYIYAIIITRGMKLAQIKNLKLLTQHFRFQFRKVMPSGEIISCEVAKTELNLKRKENEPSYSTEARSFKFFSL